MLNILSFDDSSFLTSVTGILMRSRDNMSRVRAAREKSQKHSHRLLFACELVDVAVSSWQLIKANERDDSYIIVTNLSVEQFKNILRARCLG